MKAPFVHLHLHSEYSIVDSTVRIGQLVERCREQQMPAVGLTDQGNLFGMVKFYKTAAKNGIKPIIGVDLRIASPGDLAGATSLVLLCQDRVGYRNLNQLLSRSYHEGQERGIALVHQDWLTRAGCEGLIALSGGLNGDIGHAFTADKPELAAELLDNWVNLFGDRFYVELSRTGKSGEEDYIQHVIELASEKGVPVVATNDVRFLDTEDYYAHEARVCIHEGRTLGDKDRQSAYTKQQYLRDADEMARLFSDIPEALANTAEIAKRCNLNLKLGKSFLPEFPVPEGETAASFLQAESEKALQRYLEHLPGEKVDSPDQYRERLASELKVICEMGFPGYFLIVADFINWAKNNEIPVGPGRGSGAGSLVAFVLGITDLDPLEHNLLFERFLNPERVSMPDFDIDFCMEGRDRVIDYVAERYGRDRVSQIITYGTMAAKAVIRDAGRVLDQPYGFVDRIAKQVPFEIGMTLDKALEQEEELAKMYAEDEEVRSIIDLARSLEGLVRNAGKHAGGVVISPTQLTDFTPLYCEEGGANTVTQLDKDDVEAIGLVKFDFLGLRTLTIIDWAVRIINAGNDMDELDIRRIPMQDAATFSLLQQCLTTAVFQLESRGMKDLIKRLRPDHFDDLVALVALFRPGPLQSGMVDDFISRKHDPDKSRIDYLHPDLRPVLKETYGVILYQEQVMQIAQVLAGYTLGGADLLRRAMGKKNAEEMAKQREIFVTGACQRGVEEGTATRIFDLMEKFAGYGFNKSHSAAYALLAYQTAYLKAHYPAAFMAAVMSADMDNTDRLVVIKDDCRQLSLEVLPPNVNKSAYHFSVATATSILYGLGAIKSVGRSAVESIIEERSRNGAFSSLSEFCRRVDHDKVNRRTVEAMIKAGALDDFGVNRRSMMHQLPVAMKAAEQQARAAEAGQNDMFGMAPVVETQPEARLEELLEWHEGVLLSNEKEALGLYLTGHPFDAVRTDARFFVDATLADIAAEPQPVSSNGERNYMQGRREMTVAGLITDVRKRGNRYTVVLDDDSGRLELSLFAETYQEFRDLLVKDEIVVVSGTLGYDDFVSGWRMSARRLESIDRVIESRAQSMIISLQPNGQGEALLHKLHDVLMPYRRGRCEVSVQYTGSQAAGRLNLGPEWTVRPSRELRDKLSELLGHDSVRLLYAPNAK